MTTPEPLTISSVAVAHPTEALVELSDGTTLRLSVETIQALQVAAAGTAQALERAGEP